MELADPSATEALAQTLAQSRPDPAVIHLRGDLGTGKSTLARAMLRVLGVTGTVRSPTYTLIERYPLGAQREAVHMDLYRIADADELEFLGLDELTEHAGLWLIEWPERGSNAIPPPDLSITLSHAGDGRSAELAAANRTGRAWLDRLAQFVGA